MNTVASLLVVCCGIPIILLILRWRKQVKQMDFTRTYPFAADEYHNPKLFAALLARGYLMLAFYIGNCCFVLSMCCLNGTLPWIGFGCLFTVTSLVLWYVNLYRVLEFARKPQMPTE